MMLYPPSRRIWQRSRELLANLTLSEWEQGTRPWHRDRNWRPGSACCPGLDTQRRMHALGIIFPGAGAVRREVTGGAAGLAITSPTEVWPLAEATPADRLDR